MNEKQNKKQILFTYLVLICSFKPIFLKTGPKKNTVVDFWRMIWQEEVTSVIMLTNLKEGDKVIITVEMR